MLVQYRIQSQRGFGSFSTLHSLGYFLPYSSADEETFSDAVNSTLRSPIASSLTETFSDALSSSYGSPFAFPVSSSLRSLDCSTYDCSYGVANG
jgi:hypothetical protein